MFQYLDLLSELVEKAEAGHTRPDRTGTGTAAVFGPQMRFDLSQGFPLLTTKRVFVKGFVHELLWMLSGDTNNKYLTDKGVHIWDEWVDSNGNLGPVYGRQWRHWTGPDGKIHDQISDVIHDVYKTPYSRRLVVSAWNVGELSQMKLHPCHCLFQFFVEDGKLSCQLYQRSADFFLGVPFNIASYALLIHMVASVTDLEVGELVWTGGDTHLYLNHLDAAKEQLRREPMSLPRLELTKRTDGRTQTIFDYKFEDIKFIGYDPHDAIKAEISV